MIVQVVLAIRKSQDLGKLYVFTRNVLTKREWTESAQVSFNTNLFNLQAVTFKGTTKYMSTEIQLQHLQRLTKQLALVIHRLFICVFAYLRSEKIYKNLEYVDFSWLIRNIWLHLKSNPAFYSHFGYSLIIRGVYPKRIYRVSRELPVPCK